VVLWGSRLRDKIPDHSAFSRVAMSGRNSDIFRSVFERVVGACIGGLSGGREGLAVDASLIVAGAIAAIKLLAHSGTESLTHRQ